MHRDVNDVLHLRKLDFDSFKIMHTRSKDVQEV